MLPADEDEAEAPEEGEGPPSELASDKQLSFIRVLQEKMSLEDAALADILDEVAGVRELAALGRREASDVIDELQVRAREEGIDLDAQPRASEKQVGFMRSLKRRAHLTDDEFAAFLEEHAGVREPELVGKRDASRIIDELLKRAEGAKGGPGGKPAGGRPAGGAGAPTGKKATGRKGKTADAPPPPAADDDVPF